MKEYFIEKPMPQFGKDVYSRIPIPDEIVAEIRADAIDECKYKIVDSLEKQLGCKVCSSYEEKYHCSKCKMQEIINLTVDILELLKNQK